LNHRGCRRAPGVRSRGPIAGRDGAAAVWTGRQLLVWGGHGRIPGVGLRPLRDGATDDPAGDRWQPIPTPPGGVQGTSATAAWPGTRILVWDAPSAGGRTSGALYDPVRAGGRRSPTVRPWVLTAPGRCGPAPSW
jgi:hypothetical protein